MTDKERYHKNKERLNRLKCSPCMDCGKCYNPWVMHFDHRDPMTKKNGVSALCTDSWQSVEREIAKCDLVCANCHAERTHKQRQLGLIKTGGRYLKV